MNEEHVVILAALLCISTSLTFHYFWTSWFNASVLAGLIFSFLWQVIAYIDLGYMDPFAPIGFAMGTLAGIGVGMIVGLPFLIYRRNESSKRTPKCS